MRARTIQTSPGARSRSPEHPSYSVGSTHRGPTDRKQRPDDEMSGDTRALRQTTGSLPEQAAAGPDDTNRSRNRSPKRPQYSGRDAVFPIRQAIGPDSTTRQSPSAAPLPANDPQDGGNRNRPPSRYGGTEHRHTYFSGNYILRYAEVSACRLRIRPQTSAATDYASGRPAPDRHQEDHPENAATESPHSTSEYAVVLYQAGISPAQSSARPQAGEPPDESAIPEGQEKSPRRQRTPSPTLRSRNRKQKTEGTRNKGRPPGNYKIIICWVRDDFILSNIPYFR